MFHLRSGRIQTGMLRRHRFEAAETAKTTGTCSGALSVTCRLIKGSMSELVVKLLLLWITQNVVSLIYILKHLLRRLIARIGVRMILLCQFSICTFNCRSIRVSRDAQHIIIISLCR